MAGTSQNQIPIAQIDRSSKEIHLGPPGPAPADVLLMLPLNSVVKVLQGNGTVLGAQHIRSPGGRSAAAPSAGREPSPEDGVICKKHKTDQLSCTTETKMGPTTIKISRNI